MKHSMNNCKYLFAALLVGGLMSGCSSENEVTDEGQSPDSNIGWVNAKVNTSVVKGDNENEGAFNKNEGVLTRGMDEVDPELKNPKGEFPEGTDLYIAFYINGELSKDKFIELDKANGYAFSYRIGDGNEAKALSEEELEVHFMGMDKKEVALKYSDISGKNRFIFTSFNPSQGTQFGLKKMNAGENRYPDFIKDPYVEYHDKLFSSDGMFFDKEEDKFVVKSQASGSIHTSPVTQWDVTLRRMTACITLSTIIIEKFENNNPVNINGITSSTPKDEIIKLTDARLHEAGYPRTLSVTDIFTREKVFQQFPIRYDFIDGPITDDLDYRGNVYLCNLEEPAWMDETSKYQFGDDNGGAGEHTIVGVASQCDNYPFFPSTGFEVRDISLLLFMGIRDRTLKDSEDAVSKQTILAYEIPVAQSEGLKLQHNTNHYLYLALTVDDIMKMYNDFNNQGKTRSGAGEKIIQLPSRQLIIK